ncbi:hypothetical protein EAG_07600 [Camponotus floridanus]|uniref:Uncharacterized protein n=1 Tax=Camponotus floridanus TaxID=104421 RepID=E2AZM3_CAMFO|nr:hypothetical protein EAG_07600 [Camponotus floridanus]
MGSIGWVGRKNGLGVLPPVTSPIVPGLESGFSVPYAHQAIKAGGSATPLLVMSARQLWTTLYSLLTARGPPSFSLSSSATANETPRGNLGPLLVLRLCYILASYRVLDQVLLFLCRSGTCAGRDKPDVLDHSDLRLPLGKRGGGGIVSSPISPVTSSVLPSSIRSSSVLTIKALTLVRASICLSKFSNLSLFCFWFSGIGVDFPPRGGLITTTNGLRDLLLSLDLASIVSDVAILGSYHETDVLRCSLLRLVQDALRLSNLPFERLLSSQWYLIGNSLILCRLDLWRVKLLIIYGDL